MKVLIRENTCKMVSCIAAVCIFSANPAAAQSASQSSAIIPSGIYGCLTDIGGYLNAFGTIEIRGNSYRYTMVGSKPGKFSPFTVGPTGQITWRGSMGALNSSPSAIVQSFLETKPRYRSIIVKYKPDRNSYIFTMGCRNDFKAAH